MIQYKKFYLLIKNSARKLIYCAYALFYKNMNALCAIIWQLYIKTTEKYLKICLQIHIVMFIKTNIAKAGII